MSSQAMIKLRSAITTLVKELTDPIPPSQKCLRSFAGPETGINRAEKKYLANQVRCESARKNVSEISAPVPLENVFD